MATKEHTGSHSLIVGMTESGKTTLAKKFALAAQKRGIPCIIYDPLLSDWGQGARVFDVFAEFEQAIEELPEPEFVGQLIAYAFIDEADTVLSQSDRENWWIMTRGRHYGLRVFPITQRPKLISPTARGQCATLYCFRVSADDAKALAADFSDEGIKAAAGLAQGAFLWSRWETGTRKISQHDVFVKKPLDAEKKIG